MTISALIELQTTAVHELQAVFLLLLVFVILFALVAERLQTPYPIVLVLAGLVLGFVPGMPRVTLNPDIVFLVVLPPLLFAAAWTTSWREFRFNLVSITMLAFALVGFTVAGVALAAPHLLPGFDWRLGFLLGAVVATTDAIAAAGVAQKVGLPRRIMDVLEGESLLNDATGLLALEFGLAMFLKGETPTVLGGALRLLWLTVGGLGVGLLIGFLVDRFERRVEYTSLEIVLSILVPYATYLAAETVHASGVLAVVAAGLYLGHRSIEFYSPQVRLQAAAVWDALTFALNGLTFILIGLQLPAVREGIAGRDWPRLLVSGMVFSALLIAFRLVWVFPGAWLAVTLRRKLLRQDVSWPPARQVFVIGWTGMRGVIALAAALSLPVTLSNGQPFPERDFIVFLTFSVILVTLVLQGLTLPGIIRLLRLGVPSGSHTEELKARQIILQTALDGLEAMRVQQPELATLHDDLKRHYTSRLQALSANKNHDGADATPPAYTRYRAVMRELLRLERREALRLRDEGRIGDETLRQLMREMDLAETRFTVAKE